MMPIRPDPDSFGSEDPDPGVFLHLSSQRHRCHNFLLFFTVYGNFSEKSTSNIPYSLALHLVVIDTDRNLCIRIRQNDADPTGTESITLMIPGNRFLSPKHTE
jgi:hypothetical protein